MYIVYCNFQGNLYMIYMYTLSSFKELRKSLTQKHTQVFFLFQSNSIFTGDIIVLPFYKWTGGSCACFHNWTVNYSWKVLSILFIFISFIYYSCTSNIVYVYCVYCESLCVYVAVLKVVFTQVLGIYILQAPLFVYNQTISLRKLFSWWIPKWQLLKVWTIWNEGKKIQNYDTGNHYWNNHLNFTTKSCYNKINAMLL